MQETITTRHRMRLFLAKFEIGPGCWEWQAATSDGYGVFTLAGRRVRRAHRVSYSTFVGPIPDDRVTHHTCMNKACIRPDHLEITTHEDNLLKPDGAAGIRARTTHCPQGHPYSGDNLALTDSGYRRCRACNRERARRNHQRKTRSDNTKDPR